jgi:hypothetical protein
VCTGFCLEEAVMKKSEKPVIFIILPFILFIYGGWTIQVLLRPGLPERVKILMTFSFILTFVVMVVVVIAVLRSKKK